MTGFWAGPADTSEARCGLQPPGAAEGAAEQAVGLVVVEELLGGRVPAELAPEMNDDGVEGGSAVDDFAVAGVVGNQRVATLPFLRRHGNRLDGLENGEDGG